MGKLHKLLLKGNVFYFKSDDENAIFKKDPNKGYFIKWKGRGEFPVETAKSDLLVDALLDLEEIEKTVWDTW